MEFEKPFTTMMSMEIISAVTEMLVVAITDLQPAEIEIRTARDWSVVSFHSASFFEGDRYKESLLVINDKQQHVHKNKTSGTTLVQSPLPVADRE